MKYTKTLATAPLLLSLSVLVGCMGTQNESEKTNKMTYTLKGDEDLVKIRSLDKVNIDGEDHSITVTLDVFSRDNNTANYIRMINSVKGCTTHEEYIAGGTGQQWTSPATGKECFKTAELEVGPNGKFRTDYIKFTEAVGSRGRYTVPALTYISISPKEYGSREYNATVGYYHHHGKEGTGCGPVYLKVNGLGVKEYLEPTNESDSTQKHITVDLGYIHAADKISFETHQYELCDSDKINRKDIVYTTGLTIMENTQG
ncbi:hypothetical protein [Pseudoalteromonas sp. Of11M-6]|uniref:hypothetical protein n=1 Tax=Pseudoalteromonas sp. Of11M-6 TaxID=2917754 RepID=UPI001EF65DE5|nr:hypothetical protein [Pseudoalteromonas sp. Of11M-6]MCG7554870.1 hypothetical protein [Pseudoalteromonas sp. Of11M-6]